MQAAEALKPSKEIQWYYVFSCSESDCKNGLIFKMCIVACHFPPHRTTFIFLLNSVLFNSA